MAVLDSDYDYYVGEDLKKDLSQNLASFKPGNLVVMNPLTYDEIDLKSLYFYFDIEDVNNQIGMTSPRWLNQWIETGHTNFHKRAFVFLEEKSFILARGEKTEIIPIATIFDCKRVLNIPLYLLSEPRNNV